MISGIGSFEILAILIVVLILFGSKQLPQAARMIGKGMHDLQKASKSVQDEIHKVMYEEPSDSSPADHDNEELQG